MLNINLLHVPNKIHLFIYLKARQTSTTNGLTFLNRQSRRHILQPYPLHLQHLLKINE